MRAVVYDKFGGESVLAVRDIAEPDPAPGEVKVAISFASLNPIDFKLRAGLFAFIGKPKRPAITGKDFAGRIVALGAGTSGFSVGQRVFGSVDPMQGRGSCAESVSLSTDLVAATPDAISDEAAACLPVASGTALQALVAIAGLQGGQSILISGASGAVGSSAVQIARSLGARITGVCSTANVEYVRSIGAHEVIDYRTAKWPPAGSKFDIFFDAAGASSFPAAFRSLSSGGYYINTFPTPAMFLYSPLVGIVSSMHCVPFMLKTDAKLLQDLARLAEQMVLQPRIARVIGLQEVAAAQRDMKDGKVHGKVCVSIAR